MGKLDGRVAIITGGARGQGRSHALTLAREGADIVVCDIAGQIESAPYPMSNENDLQKTVKLVEELGRRCVAVKADVRDREQMKAVADKAIEEFGKIDILCANAGIFTFGTIVNTTQQVWNDTIDTNLTGVFNAMQAVLPHMISQKYGRIVATSSMVGRAGFPNILSYVAAKWGIIGMVKAAAIDVATLGITVNAVCPGTVNTPMAYNEAMYRLFRPELPNPGREDIVELYKSLMPMGTPHVEPQDISNAILYLVSNDARYVTGEAIHVAAAQNANNAC